MNVLNRNDFLEKVCNFVENPEWRYLGDLPCVIDFYDDSCPPCQAIEPVISALEKKFADRVVFYKVDVAAEEQLAGELGLVNLPTLVLCAVDDKPIVLQGIATEKDLSAKIDAELLGG